MWQPIQIGDELTVDDPISMCHECTGIVSDITEEGMVRLDFCDGSYGWFEPKYLESYGKP